MNGEISNPIFGNLDYDILAIGNHELYVTEVAYSHFYNFSKIYGDRYLTSNVEIRNPETNEFETLGNKYRYFTTEQGMLYQFAGFACATTLTLSRTARHGLRRSLQLH